MQSCDHKMYQTQWTLKNRVYYYPQQTNSTYIVQKIRYKWIIYLRTSSLSFDAFSRAWKTKFMQLYGRTLHKMRILESFLTNGTLQSSRGRGCWSSRRCLIGIWFWTRTTAYSWLRYTVCDSFAGTYCSRAYMSTSGWPSPARWTYKMYSIIENTFTCL